MNNIGENLKKIRSLIPKHVTLVAVSKTKPATAIRDAYDCGQRVFGENRALEMAEKQKVLPPDISWHMIGHLQSNKVKYIAPFVALIHGVDSFKLLREIDKQGAKCGRVIPCLLQFHIAQERSKFGFNLEEAEGMLTDDRFWELEHVTIAGVMGMATFSEDPSSVRAEFSSLREIFELLKKKYFPNDASFKTLSMGMSGDFEIAIEEGSNMVRVGSKIFGSRS